MAGMLQLFVKNEMEKQMQEKYPYAKYPVGMYAKIAQVKASGSGYMCTLKILDKELKEDKNFPEIPNVKTGIELKQGDVAVILFLYGGDSVYIAGRREP